MEYPGCRMGNNLSKSLKPSVAVRYAVSITLLILVGMSIVAYVTFRNQSQVHKQLQLDFSRILSQQIANSAVEPFFTDNDFELSVLLKNLNNNHRIAGVIILNHEKNIVANTGLIIPINTFKNNLESNAPIHPFKNQPGHKYENIVLTVSPITYQNVVGGYSVLAVNNENIADLLRESFETFLLVSLILCASISLLGIAMARKLSEPITELANATLALRQGEIKHIPERRRDEIGELVAAFNTMSNGLVEKDHVEVMLKKLVDRDVANKIIGQMEEVELGGEHIHASVLFADIVGFTNISESLSPKEISNLLNEYYNYFNQCAKFYFGTVDKFIGDAVMLVFGAPNPDKNHQYNAIACAVLMNQLVDRLNNIRRQQGLFEVNLRIGINSGNMIAGLIGSEDRAQYTVVGDAVNLASRLCNEAESSQIIIEESLYQEVQGRHNIDAETRKRIKIRGKSEPVAIYNVSHIDQPYSLVIDNLLEDLLAERKSA